MTDTVLYLSRLTCVGLFCIYRLTEQNKHKERLTSASSQRNSAGRTPPEVEDENPFMSLFGFGAIARAHWRHLVFGREAAPLPLHAVTFDPQNQNTAGVSFIMVTVKHISTNIFKFNACWSVKHSHICTIKSSDLD